MDIAELRKIAENPYLYTKDDLGKACFEAANIIEELCQQIDGCVRVAADALSEVKSLKEAQDVIP